MDKSMKKFLPHPSMPIQDIIGCRKPYANKKQLSCCIDIDLLKITTMKIIKQKKVPNLPISLNEF